MDVSVKLTAQEVKDAVNGYLTSHPHAIESLKVQNKRSKVTFSLTEEELDKAITEYLIKAVGPYYSKGNELLQRKPVFNKTKMHEVSGVEVIDSFLFHS